MVKNDALLLSQTKKVLKPLHQGHSITKCQLENTISWDNRCHVCCTGLGEKRHVSRSLLQHVAGECQNKMVTEGFREYQDQLLAQRPRDCSVSLLFKVNLSCQSKQTCYRVFSTRRASCTVQECTSRRPTSISHFYLYWRLNR